MSDVLLLSGQLNLGPKAVDESSFPAGLLSVSLTLAQGENGKDAKVHSAHVRELSGGGYVNLRGVGAGESVTKGTFLYLRASSEMLVRITTFDAGGDVVAIIPVKGTVIIEFDANKYLKLIEASGSGTIEHLVTGSE